MLVATEPIMANTANENKRQLTNSWDENRELALASWSAKAAGIPKRNYQPASFLR